MSDDNKKVWVCDSVSLWMKDGDVQMFNREDDGVKDCQLIPGSDIVMVFLEDRTVNYHWGDVASHEVRGHVEEGEGEATVSKLNVVPTEGGPDVH